MKKIISLLVFFVITTQIFGQKFYTKTGTLNFEASVEAFEPVKASNKTTTAILDVTTGKIAVLGLVKGFRFRNSLMEEHFNENYMDSDTFPKATFNGVVQGFSVDDISTEKEYKLKGELVIHGVTKQVDTSIFIAKKSEAISVKTDFSVTPAEFDIKIPNVVKKKISDKINISVDLLLVKK